MWNDVLIPAQQTEPIQAYDHQFQRVPSLLQPGRLLSGVRCVEYHSSAENLRNYHGLPVVEQELVATAVDRRKAEFGDSRWCAHRAMEQFIPDQPILRGHRGMPEFPTPVVGSMTHTTGYRAAVVGRASRWNSLGIDAEPLTALPEGVFATIASPEERAGLRRLSRRLGRGHDGQGALGVVLFSAKEAVYKAWYPLTQQFLDFDQARIELREDGSFRARLLVGNAPVPTIEGLWSAAEGYALTMAGVRA